MRITVNRKNSKIKILLAVIKKANIISDESFQILNNEFGEMSSSLFKNEYKDQNRSAHGRRYDEIKRFAVTLHYHSPKAYGYCRLACVFFLLKCLAAFKNICVHSNVVLSLSLI